MSNERGGDDRIRDGGMQAAWRAASTEEPAPSADTAILAAARAATRSMPKAAAIGSHRRWWTQWQPLVAAAGVAGLAFLLVQRLPTAPESRVPSQAPTTSAPAALETHEAPAARESAGVPEARQAAPAPAAVTAPTAAVSPAADGPAANPAPIEVPAATSSPIATQAAPSAVTASSPSHVAESSRELDANAAPGAPMPAARAEATGLAAAKSTVAAPDPDAWVQRIVALHEAGDLPAATDELRAFRLAFRDADDRLPVELREWAATVGPAVH